MKYTDALVLTCEDESTKYYQLDETEWGPSDYLLAVSEHGSTILTRQFDRESGEPIWVPGKRTYHDFEWAAFILMEYYLHKPYGNVAQSGFEGLPEPDEPW